MPRLKLPSFVKRPNFENKKAWLLAVLAVVIVFGVWAIFINKPHGKIYAQAAGHKIYKKEVKDLIGDHTEITEHQAAQVLADKYLTEALAKERGITVTDKELADKYGKETLPQKTEFKYAYQNKLNQLYFSKLSAYNDGVYKGKFLIANFSQHIQVYPTLPEDRMHDPKLGNAAAIAADKKYAEDFITDLYNKITSGKITFDQAIKLEHNDPRVGLKAYPELEHSGSFDTTYTPRQIINNPSIREKINSIKAGETTKPFVVRVSNSLADPKSTVESYFLVVHMDQTSGSYTGTDFGQYLKQAKERLDYKIFV
ncbi:MAG TPA: hypothetical protein VFW77_04190 [Candidatus Saccharimonadales bacterium]|nr:hypothetical protein [Candidatus Saccharimonadales bacterium]